ncbi:type II CAAX prenyl endopeptidase Rce1 family protein [Nocardioides zhouii]|uniref:CPBP family intramembrane metalloprotease n=1 Tax=Nocardioides zhouii TaxID=1168729 RepID=A0A4Q2T3W6_9ACTN|nr:CPBP family glutamic-type intramembrane protease [Nocardioides zhouii]RYC13272.1 CPBP family intramembrane metalloprotease [Nocardioides zhouii]
MTTPVQLVRRHPISAFAVLACLFGWMPYIVTALGIGSNPENFPLGPVIAALLVTSCQGREALFAWGRTLRRWAASPWLYALAFGAPALLQVAIVLVNHQLGAPLPTAGQLGSWPEVPVTFLAMLVFVGLGEEAGWTAFAAPVLLRRFGLLGAFGVLAPLRIFWHLPLMLTGDMPLVVGILGNAGFQLVVLLLLRNRRGSWTLAAVWHSMLNAFGNAFFFSMVTGADRDRLNVLLGLEYALVAAVAMAIFHLAGRRHEKEGPELEVDEPDRLLVG